MVVIVIDQFAYHYLPKLKPFLRDGIKLLLDNGINFKQANYPHAMPATGPGHTALGTGCFAKDHGIIGNHWRLPSGKKVSCDDDTTKRSPVFNGDGSINTTLKGKSARNILVDGLSDQYLLDALARNHDAVAYSLSMKSRAAIGMGTKMAKSIWFDAHNGLFTSSKAFFDELPTWIIDFNKSHCSPALKSISWTSAYPLDSDAYRFPYIRDYNHAEFPGSLIANSPEQYHITQPNKEFIKDSSSYELFLKTPASGKLLLELAKNCIELHLKEHPERNMLLWISLSSLDKVGHAYGQDSIECIDTVYHTDRQIGELIQFVHNYVNEEEVMFVLTADHGCMPMPEILAKKGYPARRVNVQSLTEKLNEAIYKKFKIKDLIVTFKCPQFYFNEKLFQSLPKKLQNNIEHFIKYLLLKHPAIKSVWTFDELAQAPVIKNTIMEFFKNQLYRNRSGRITCQTHPYMLFSDYPSGTSHQTPYNYDTQVPLILYQQNHLEKKSILKQVWLQQLAPTLARLLEVPKPSASHFWALPGIFA